jgi:hypothetical protein
VGTEGRVKGVGQECPTYRGEVKIPTSQLMGTGSDMEGRVALIAPQRTRRGAVAPTGPSFGKERLSQDDSAMLEGGV